MTYFFRNSDKEIEELIQIILKTSRNIAFSATDLAGISEENKRLITIYIGVDCASLMMEYIVFFCSLHDRTDGLNSKIAHEAGPRITLYFENVLSDFLFGEPEDKFFPKNYFVKNKIIETVSKISGYKKFFPEGDAIFDKDTAIVRAAKIIAQDLKNDGFLVEKAIVVELMKACNRISGQLKQITRNQ